MMRKQREVKIVSSNIEFMEEEKKQLESRLAVINSVIDNYKTWVTDKGNNQFTFFELLQQFSHLADTCVQDVGECRNRAQSLQNFDSIPSVREANETFYHKMLSRLDVIEEDISSLKSSHKANEKQLSDINKRYEDLKFSHEEQAIVIDSIITDQTDKFTIVQNEVRDQRNNIGAISKHMQRFSNDVSSTQALRLKFEATTQSTSDKIKNLTFKFNRLDTEMMSVKPRIQNLNSSFDVFTKSTEMKQNDQNVKIKELETKIESKLSESSTAFDTKTSKELQQSHLPGILLKKQRCTGFMEKIYKLKSPKEKCQLDAENKKRLLDYSKQNIIKSHVDFQPETGIFKVDNPGVYLISCNLFYFGKETKEVFLSSIIRENDTILTFFNIDTVMASNRGGRLFHVSSLELGDEICLQTDSRELENISVESFACVRLF